MRRLIRIFYGGGIVREESSKIFVATLLEEAEQLLIGCGRFDLLNKLYQV